MGMSEAAKKEYADSIRSRYFKASREEKGFILQEFCAVSGYHRKSALRMLRRRINRLAKDGREPIPRKRGRKSTYGSDPLFMEALRALWQETDYMCGKNLPGAIQDWLPSLQRHRNLSISAAVEAKLLTVSGATIDRLLKPHKAALGRRHRSGTKPGTLLRSSIEIQTDAWSANVPGFLEADTVAHCGGSLSGQFVWSLTVTDIFSQWTEIRAIWHKGAAGILDAIREIEQTLPFEIHGFDSDNGGEFINHSLHKYFTQRSIPVAFTRSREYQSNDNAHVEGKNWTHVRQLLGYERIDNIELTDCLNVLVRRWSLFRNHFFPVRKLISKRRHGSKYHRIYDTPATPYARLMSCPCIRAETKATLKQIHESLDPVVERRSIRSAIRRLLQHASVTSSSEATIPEFSGFGNT